MFYNKATYNGFITESASDATALVESPLQFAIEAAETDQKLFNALIEVDMAECMNERGIISLSESDVSFMHEASENGIVAKIKALVEKFKNAVKALFQKFTSWVSNLVSNDAKIYEKYKKVFTEDKVKNCDAKGTTINYDEYEKYMAASDAFSKAVESAISKVDEGVGDKMKADIANAVKQLEAMKAADIIDNSDGTIISKINLGSISNLSETVKVGYKKEIDYLTAWNKTNEFLIKAAQQKAVQLQADANSKKELNYANTTYEGISKILSLAAQAYSLKISVAKRRIAIERANFIKLGNYALNGGSKNDKVKESAVYDEIQDTLIDFQNEQFCESIWETV